MSNVNRSVHRSVLLFSPLALLVLFGSACAGQSPVDSSSALSEGFSLEGEEAMAVNDATGLAASIAADGAFLSLDGTEVSLKTVGWGDSDGLNLLDGDAAPELICDDNGDCDQAVAVARPGLSERWDIHPSGFEQSWVVDAPRGEEDTLRIEVAVGGASLRQLPGQPGVWLDAEDGTMFQYDGLHVLDADGVALDAHMEVAGDHIRILADVTDAAWPVTVDPVVTTASWSGVGSSSWDKYGRALASGDFNGDTWLDVAIAAPHDWGCTSASVAGLGKVIVTYGSSFGLGLDPSKVASTISAPSSSTCYGLALTAGDFDFDGDADLAVGSPGNTSFTGAVYVYNGSTSGIATTASTTLTGTTTNCQFGGYLDTGYLPSDDYADLIVGAEKCSSSKGQVRVFKGPSLGTACTITGTAAAGRFGEEVEMGDINGDGYDELIVGAVGASQVSIISVPRACTTSSTTLTAPTGLTWFGGEIEVLQHGTRSAPDIAVSGSAAGVGRVYLCSPTAGCPTTYTTDSSTTSEFGAHMTSMDLDSDGYTDLAVGAAAADSSAGRVYVYDNDAGTLSSPTVLYGPYASGQFGGALIGLHDLDGSGSKDDLLVGASSASVAIAGSPKDNNGAAQIYTGY